MIKNINLINRENKRYFIFFKFLLPFFYIYIVSGYKFPKLNFNQYKERTNIKLEKT
jgi:hypothetical protein